MAGFCGNCGAKLDEGQRVCGQCGTPVEGTMKTPVIRVDNPEKKKKSKRRFKAVTAIIVVVLIGVIAVNVVLKRMILKSSFLCPVIFTITVKKIMAKIILKVKLVKLLSSLKPLSVIITKFLMK